MKGITKIIELNIQDDSLRNKSSTFYNTNKYWRYRVLIALMLISLIYYILSIPFHQIFYPSKSDFYLVTDIIGILFSLLAITSFFMFNYVKLAITIIFITSIIILSSTIYQTGGLMSHATIWLIVFPVGFGFINGKRGALVGGGVSLSIITAFLVLHFLHPELTITVPAKSLFFRIRGIIGANILLTTIIYFVQKKIERKYKMLIDSNDKVQELLQIIGHDIRNPISLITNSSKQIQKNINNCHGVLLDLHQLEASPIKIINESTSTIINIIEQVRELQAIDRGKLEIELESTTLMQIFIDIKYLLSKKLNNKKISLSVSFDNYEEQNDYSVMANGQILMNSILLKIIENSIKYSFVDSNIDVFISSNSENMIVIEINDQGIGIPESLIDDIFVATKKNIRVGTMNETGVGFSLPIAKRYIIAFDGTINLKTRSISRNPSNHGTTFIVTLNRSADIGYKMIKRPKNKRLGAA